ncbi:MAG: RDD family protein [Acidimicrobiales bacterium]
MARKYRCHSCGEEVSSAQRRCPHCYVALRGATRGPEPLRAAPSASPRSAAPAVNGQLALATADASPGMAPLEAPVAAPLAAPAPGTVPDAATQPAPATRDGVEEPRSPLVRCLSCETTVSSVGGRCSYCLEPLDNGLPTPVVTTEMAAWGFDDMNDLSTDDRPDAQIIVGPWGQAGDAGAKVEPAIEPDPGAVAWTGATDPPGSAAALVDDDPSDARTTLAPPAFVEALDALDTRGGTCATPAPTTELPPTDAGDLSAGIQAAPAADVVGFLGAAGDAEAAQAHATADFADDGARSEADEAASVTWIDTELGEGPSVTWIDTEPCEGPATESDTDAEAAPMVLSASSCATWSQRRRATLIDIVVLVPALVALAVNLTVGAMLLVDAVVLLVWQLCFLQGRTGQTLGKHVTKIYLVRESDHGVIGHRMAMWRELCHLADIKQLLSFRLRPYRGPKRQTVADRLANTVCSTEPPTYTLSSRGKRLPD